MNTIIRTILFIVCCFVVARPFVAAADPNETNVPDNRDFKDTKLEFESASGDITANVLFYDAPNLGSFWIYISIDNDNLPEYKVTCHASYFSIREHTPSGTVGPEVYRETPTVNGRKYTLVIPIKAMGLNDGTRRILKYWFFWMSGGTSASDRLPDTNELQLRIN
jgi:hypothetical protein